MDQKKGDQKSWPPGGMPWRWPPPGCALAPVGLSARHRRPGASGTRGAVYRGPEPPLPVPQAGVGLLTTCPGQMTAVGFEPTLLVKESQHA